MPSKTLVIGAAGAVGKRLCQALRNAGSIVIAADRREHLPSSVKDVAHTLVGGADVRDPEGMELLFKEHAGRTRRYGTWHRPCRSRPRSRPRLRSR